MEQERPYTEAEPETAAETVETAPETAAETPETPVEAAAPKKPRESFFRRQRRVYFSVVLIEILHLDPVRLLPLAQLIVLRLFHANTSEKIKFGVGLAPI